MPWTLPKQGEEELEELRSAFSKVGGRLAEYFTGKIPGTVPQGIKELYTALPEIMERTDRFVRTDSGDYDPRVLDLALEALGGSIPGGAKGASSLGIARKDFIGGYLEEMSRFIGKERNPHISSAEVYEEFGKYVTKEELKDLLQTMKEMPQWAYNPITDVEVVKPYKLEGAQGMFHPETGRITLGEHTRDPVVVPHELSHGIQHEAVAPEALRKTKKQKEIIKAAEEVRNAGFDLYFEGIKRADGSTMTGFARHDRYDPIELGADRFEDIAFAGVIDRFTEKDAHDYLSALLLLDTDTVMRRLKKDFPGVKFSRKTEELTKAEWAAQRKKIVELDEAIELPLDFDVGLGTTRDVRYYKERSFEDLIERAKRKEGSIATDVRPMNIGLKAKDIP